MASSQQQHNTLKRKAPAIAEPGRSARQKKQEKKRQQTNATQTAPFPFLTLPAELRNIVYGMVAEEYTAYVKKRILTDRSNLALVNRQIRDEYHPVSLLCAKNIQTKVVDFDFRHIVTFINRLSTSEVNALPNATKPGTRRIDVTLVFSNNPADHYLLRRWLNRAGHPTKKGTMLDFRYTLKTPEGFKPLRFDHRDYVLKTLEWRRLVSPLALYAGEGRAKDEAEEISRAWNDIV